MTEENEISIQSMYCRNCGKCISARANECPACGDPIQSDKQEGKSKTTFVILALLVGAFGIHRFYLGGMGNVLLGLLYFCIFYTGVPTMIAIGEAIVIGFRKNDPRFKD